MQRPTFFTDAFSSTLLDLMSQLKINSEPRLLSAISRS